MQGFYINNDDDVKALAQYCKHVYVDVQKIKANPAYAQHNAFSPTSKTRKNKAHAESNVLKLPPLVVKSPQHYESSAPIGKEAARAKKLHAHVYEAIDNVFSSIHSGGCVSLKETESVAQGMVDSIIRNPDALVWLAKMRDDDAHSYQHSVKASIWALVFGRHLGLEKGLLKHLAMGVLLAHIGKHKLDFNLVEAADTLEGKQLNEYQRYVEYSVDILEAMGNIPAAVISIAKYHQERHNGSGFPQGVTGDRIPLLAKIAGLVDCYQNLITPRNGKQGLSPLEAVARLYEQRNIEFQQDLVERFIEAVGVYPTGTLVRLGSGEVAIVIGHNQDRRLMPKIMVVLDENKQPLKHGKPVDLKTFNEGKAPSEQLVIRESLPKGAYNIDESQYLLSGATSRWSWKHLTSSLAAS